ncbi:hypothetical protein N7465_005643 [Penicillium sp. CMV-2018d]|nr:hypothetical protein N7465_005643 [Penicillium sp. CMV-2018d]
MAGNLTISMSVQNLQALLVQAMRPSRDPSQPALDSRAVYGTTTYNNTTFQLGLHHPSHIPIRDTRPQMIPYASHLQPRDRYPYPEFPSLGYGPFPSPPSGLEELSTLENLFQGLQYPSNPVGSTSDLVDMDWDSEPRTESESEKRVASRGTNQKRFRSQTPDPTPNKKVRSAPDPTPAEPARGEWKEIFTRSVHKHPDLMRHLEQRKTDPVYHYYHEIMDTSSNQSSIYWNWKTENDLSADLRGLEKELLTYEQIKTLAFFKPGIRKRYETAFRWSGQIRSEYARLLETVENGRFKLPARLLHSCNPCLVGQYLFWKVSSENLPSSQTTLSPAKSPAIHPELANPPIPAQPAEKQATNLALSSQVPGSAQNDIRMAVLLHELRMTQRDRQNHSSFSQILSAQLIVQSAEVTALRDRIQRYDTLLEGHPALQFQVKKWPPLPQPTRMSTPPCPKPHPGFDST